MKKRILKKILVLLILITLIIGGLKLLGVDKWKDLTVENITDIKQTLRIYDASGEISEELNAGENRISIDFSLLPKCLINALIAVEDVRFYEHNGFDVKRIFGSLLADIKSGSFEQGASTITQQLIKNSHLTSEKSIARKVQEVLLAYQLEQKYSKNEILEMYFNFVYFGRGAYGVQAAAQSYFGKNACELTVDEAAVLVAVLKAPGRYAPHLHPDRCLERRNLVLREMNKNGFLSDEELKTYQQVPISIIDEEKNDYGFFTDMVLQEASDKLNIGVSDLLGGGYCIYTTMDSVMQKRLQEIYEQDELFPTNSSDGTAVQSAAAVIDSKSGKILAVIGGREHSGDLVLNRALIKRQPGSTVKPLIVYAPAMETGMLTCATVLDDYRKNFDGYEPSNFNDVYYGSTTVRNALVHSLNVPAVEVFQDIGVQEAKEFGSKMGIEFDEKDNYLALALGGFTYGISPVSLAGAYQTLANGGEYRSTGCIQKITDVNGTVMFEQKVDAERVMSEQTAFLISDMLIDASKTSKLGELPFEVSAKTGTVGFKGSDNGYTDAWTAAYNSEYTVTVWFGYDRSDAEHCLEFTGSSYPSEIAAEIFKSAYKDKVAPRLTPCEGIVYAAIDKKMLDSDKIVSLATELTPEKYKMYEYFDVKTQPNKKSDYWKMPEVPHDFSVGIDEVRNVCVSLTAEKNNLAYLIFRNGQHIATLKGDTGEKLRYLDVSVERGQKYEYSVSVRHEDIFIHGALAVSGQGAKTEITVP